MVGCGIAVGEEEAAEVEASVVGAEEEEGEVGHLVMIITYIEFICKSWTDCIRTIVLNYSTCRKIDYVIELCKLVTLSAIMVIHCCCCCCL